MSIDYPRAWQIVMETNPEDHHPDCSFRVTDGAILCDCDILNKYPETLDKKMHTKIKKNEM